MLKYSSLAAVASFAIVIASSSTTRAQSQPAGQATRASPGGLEEIIVSARKREESILKTPVLVQAITAEQIENLRINDMYQLGAVTPNLKITVGFASVGAVASLRGLGNGMAANFIDQSVLLNVDGAALSHGSFYRGALFDVAQIEVLKGPQGLFFGKSSSAGIVAVTSADPGEDWDIKATAGAEFEADEWLVDGYVSGPLSDTVGIRVAGYYNEQKGWLRNRNPTNPNDLMPDEENYGGRVTLKFDNDENLVARLKFSTTSNENNAFDGDINQRDCTGDTAQVPAYQPYDDCEINFYVSGNGPSLPYRPDLDYSLGSPNFFIGVPSSLFRDGTGYQWTDTNSALATIDYAITSGLSLASVSAYSDVEAAEAGRSFSPPPVNFFDLGAHYEQDSWSQELRLTSDFDGWFDFMVGGFYGEDESKTRLYLGVPSFTFYTDNDIDLSATTSSLFGQVLLTPLENLELSVGARYTKVKKWATSLYNRDNIPAIFGDPDGEQLGDVPYDHRYFEEDDTSPEVTLTYRPNDEVTAFVSYKQGYKGPGFNANTTATAYNANQVTPFGGENVEGFEGGIKTLLLDRELALTAAAYTYDYENLQVAFVNNVTQTVDVRNGADARVQGVELGATWQPSAIGGLTLNGFVNYNDSEYTSFPAAPCYGGQTEGCVAIAGGGTGQNLKGRTLANAPEWVAQFGLEYTRPIGSALEFGLSFNTNYSSDYLYIPELHPGGVQDDYATYDASLRVGAADRLWEVALIGRNLSNEAVVPCGQDGGTVIPGVASDPIAFVLRSRQVLLQLTMRPGHR